MPKAFSEVPKRIYSAGRKEINFLSNQKKELLACLTNLKDRNRFLRKEKMFYCRLLREYQGEEEPYSIMMREHLSKMKSMQDGLKGLKEEFYEEQTYQNRIDKKLMSCCNQIKCFKELLKVKNELESVAILNEKIENSKRSLDLKEKQINTYELRVLDLKEEHERETTEEEIKVKLLQQRLKRELNLLLDSRQALKRIRRKIDDANHYSDHHHNRGGGVRRVFETKVEWNQPNNIRPSLQSGKTNRSDRGRPNKAKSTTPSRRGALLTPVICLDPPRDPTRVQNDATSDLGRSLVTGDSSKCTWRAPERNESKPSSLDGEDETSSGSEVDDAELISDVTEGSTATSGSPSSEASSEDLVAQIGGLEGLKVSEGNEKEEPGTTTTVVIIGGDSRHQECRERPACCRAPFGKKSRVVEGHMCKMGTGKANVSDESLTPKFKAPPTPLM